MAEEKSLNNLKGNPNGEPKALNFVAKVRDPVTNDFKPVYIAPDATDTVRGDVYLTDIYDYPTEEEKFNSAATGITAITPKAAKAINENAESKLSKTETAPQTVNSSVTFKGDVIVTGGPDADNKYKFNGDLVGNADTATKLKTPVKIKTQSSNLNPGNEIDFDGSANITLPLGELDATKLKGLVPMDSIPQAAIERVYTAISLDAAVADWQAADVNSKPYQQGDTIRVFDVDNQDDQTMYIVVGDDLTDKNSYVEYAAGLASRALNADNADKLTTDAGNNTTPIYFENGIPKAMTNNIGTKDNPIYIENGSIISSNANIGGYNDPDEKERISFTPIYMDNGILLPMDNNISIGGENPHLDSPPVEPGTIGPAVEIPAMMQPIFVDNGKIKAASETIGSYNKPVYMSEGKITEIGYEIYKDVPVDAKFTDTTYKVFTENKPTEEKPELIPSLVNPPSLDETNNLPDGERLYLDNTGAWSRVAAGVSGVKGIREDAFRKGDVELSADNVGAMPVAVGETLTINVPESVPADTPYHTSSGGFLPGTATTNLGSTDEPFNNIYANTFTGNLTGTASKATVATTANQLAQSLSLTGDVTGTVSMNSAGDKSLSTTIGASKVTLSKLGTDVGTVAVQSTQPTDSRVKIWIKI